MKRVIADVSLWHIYLQRQARQLPRSAHASDHPRVQFEDELFERLYTGGLIPLEPDDVDEDNAPWVRVFHEAAKEIPDFERIAEDCAGDAVISAICTEELARILFARLEVEVPAPPIVCSAEGQAEFARTSSAQARGAARTLCAAVNEVEPVRAALRQAIVEARRTADVLRDAMEGFSDVESGVIHAGTDGTQYASLLDRLRKDRRLRAIAMLAGRMRRQAAAKQRSKTRQSSAELAGVALGDDLARILPRELARLRASRLLRLAFFRDLIEKRLLEYELRGSEHKTRGPIVVLVDKSGSMWGAKDAWATASALALLSIAAAQRRAFAIVAFDSAVMSQHVVPRGGKLPGEALFVLPQGGTDVNVALAAGLDVIEKHPGDIRKADVILISDGDAWGGERAAQLRKKATKLGVTIYGIGIASRPDQLKPWCDEVARVDDLRAMPEAVGRMIFTI